MQLKYFSRQIFTLTLPSPIEGEGLIQNILFPYHTEGKLYELETEQDGLRFL